MKKTLFLLMAAVLAMMADGFAAIPSEGGYVAVCDFICAVSLAVISLSGLYLFGGRQKKGRR